MKNSDSTPWDLADVLSESLFNATLHASPAKLCYAHMNLGIVH
jgi:hypothetical protein